MGNQLEGKAMGARRLTVALLLSGALASACSFQVNVWTGPTARPDETCPTGLQRISGISVCVQFVSNSAGSIVAVGFVNPKADQAALLTPAYELWDSAGQKSSATATSLVNSQSGLMATPKAWANDYFQVPADVAKATVTIDVTWLSGRGDYSFTRMKYHGDCYQQAPFTGCTWMNPNSYALKVHSVVTLYDRSSSGALIPEKVIGGGPDTLLDTGGGDVFVPVSNEQSSAIADWLAGSTAHRFDANIALSLDQPEFPR